MSSYPSWWDTKVTLYHKTENSITHVVTWSKTTYSNCFWHTITRKTLVDNSVLDIKRAVVRIPGSSFDINDGDIIVKGDVSDIINEYASGQRSTDLINKYKASKSCIIVSDFRLNTMTGFSTPHCYVEET